MSNREPLSIWEQARLVDQLIGRCVLHDGKLAGETTIVIDKETAAQLEHLSDRLRRIAPFEEKIKRMVTGR